MKSIIKSLVMIVAVAAVAGGATYAYFTSQASVTGNTFSTGTLEIRVNGSVSTPGFNFDKVAPGDAKTFQFTLENYGPNGFPSGSSTLDAKRLYVSSNQTSGDTNLYDSLWIDLYANAGWGGCSNSGVNFVTGKGCTVYSGWLVYMNNADILHATQWGANPPLAAGNSLTMTADVKLPESGSDQTSLQGNSAVFDLVMNAFNN